MTYNFVWSTTTAGAPIVTIALYGISFNSAVVELMRRPEKIMMGFDEKADIIGIKPIYQGTGDPKEFAFAKRERQGSVRIGNRDFVKFISAKTGEDFTRAIRYIGDWSEEEQLLTIDLNCPIDTLDSSEEEENKES